MAKSILTIVVCLITIISTMKLTGSGLLLVNASTHSKPNSFTEASKPRFDLPPQWNCAHVIQNPNQVRRDLKSRNLDGDHRIIKFIENCIKSVDGWRFKKSSPISNRLIPDEDDDERNWPLVERFFPYPINFMLLEENIKQNQEHVDNNGGRQRLSDEGEKQIEDKTKSTLQLILTEPHSSNLKEQYQFRASNNRR